MRTALNVEVSHEQTAQAALRRRSTPVFSLIVCTLRRLEELRRLFESLAEQKCQDFEVIIVDQNPLGVLDELINDYRARFIIVRVTASPGLSGARNIGLGHATGDIIAFPDDDCWYEPNTLADVRARIENNKLIAIVSGKTTDKNGRQSVSLFLRQASRISRKNYLKCGNSNCLFFRREVFHEIGRFDVRLGVGAGTGFHSGEEADVLLRAIDAGLITRYFPDLIVHHDQVDASLTAAHIERAKNYGRGFGGLLRKHRFSTFEIAYRMSRPLLGAVVSLLSGNTIRARYRWARARSIAEGYRLWPLVVDRREFVSR
jgi:GT2 family glycosyltransferase